MLAAPPAGVGRVHTDHRQTAPGGHADESVPEPAGGDTGDGAAQPLSAFPAAKSVSAGGSRVSEVEVFHHHHHHHHRTAAGLRVVEHTDGQVAVVKVHPEHKPTPPLQVPLTSPASGFTNTER